MTAPKLTARPAPYSRPISQPRRARKTGAEGKVSARCASAAAITVNPGTAPAMPSANSHGVVTRWATSQPKVVNVRAVVRPAPNSNSAWALG